MEHYPEISEVLKACRKQVGDSIESAFYQNALDGNVSAQIFYLKTQQGWSETKYIQSNVTTQELHAKSAKEFEDNLNAWKALKS